jgi:hypothetical protein
MPAQIHAHRPAPGSRGDTPHPGVTADGAMMGPQLQQRLDRVASGLEAIKDAVMSAAAAAAAGRPARTGRDSWVPPEGIEAEAEDRPRLYRARKLAGGEHWAVPYLMRIEAALEALSRPHIEVHAAIPQEIETLLKEQNRVVEKALLPLAQAAATRSEESELALSAVRSLLEQKRGRRPPT